MISQDHKDMENIIIDSAEKLFMEKGFALTTTTEIAQKAQCNQTLVHYYFRTKEKLFHAIFIKKFQFFISSFQSPGSRELPFEEKLKKFIGDHFDAISSHPQLPFFILNELTTNPARIAVLKEQFTQGVSEIFSIFDRDMKKAIKEKKIRKMETWELLLTVVSLNTSLFLLHPILNNILELNESQFNELVQKRRKQNIEMILNSLKNTEGKL